MVKEGRQSTSRELEAGKQNLQKWLAENPGRGALKHGGYSETVKGRYRDGGYKEAKEVRGVIQRLTVDAGGEGNLTEGQRLLLGVIRSDFIVIKQISEYVGRQEKIVNQQGEILPCLKSFCTFTGNMRRSIEAFYGMGKKPSKVTSLLDYLKQKNIDQKGGSPC